MQSEVNQEENLNRIITVPNLLSFFSAFCHADFCIDYTKSLLIGGKKYKTVLYFFVAK